ncbi:MAG TPA: hypothetical protein VK737_08170 [Opitutales bacterium]|jgi:hypothetical protein|nr:hypothetical protein [Opitutales bacterium]
MSTLQEIEAAIEKLPPGDLARLAEWVAARHHDEWSRQISQDAAGGKLDFFFLEAEAERSAGRLREWPGLGR